jgi:predicted nucleotidyltransferase
VSSAAESTALPATDLLAEVIRRIVEVAHPERIILFGSAARGDAGPDSDLDLLVVKRGVEHRRRLAQVIYRRLLGVEAPVDVLVVTPEDVEEFKDKAGTIIGPALREGREVYVA